MKKLIFILFVVVFGSCSIDDSNENLPLENNSDFQEKLFISLPIDFDFVNALASGSNNRILGLACTSIEKYSLISHKDNLPGVAGIGFGDIGDIGSFDDNELVVGAGVGDGWIITSSKLIVGDDMSDIGIGKNPNPGKFPYKTPDLTGINEEGVSYVFYSVESPISSPTILEPSPPTIYLAMHLELERTITNDNEEVVIEKNTAWIFEEVGQRFVTKGNWATYAKFEYCPPVAGPPSVTNPLTGRTWMDRNLGATQVATSSTDAAAYGDLYQWGRGTDGHQSRTSQTTSILSSSDTPGDGFFITGSIDWRSSQNDNLWQGVNGVNNPCPTGYRLPTETEWTDELQSWTGGNNSAGAFASPLKLPVTGYRNNAGGLTNVGVSGVYWSSTVSSSTSLRLSIVNNGSSMFSVSRANGFAVRCLKE